jgi:hypothetical protein
VLRIVLVIRAERDGGLEFVGFEGVLGERLEEPGGRREC